MVPSPSPQPSPDLPQPLSPIIHPRPRLFQRDFPVHHILEHTLHIALMRLTLAVRVHTGAVCVCT